MSYQLDKSVLDFTWYKKKTSNTTFFKIFQTFKFFCLWYAGAQKEAGASVRLYEIFVTDLDIFRTASLQHKILSSWKQIISIECNFSK